MDPLEQQSEEFVERMLEKFDSHLIYKGKLIKVDVEELPLYTGQRRINPNFKFIMATGSAPCG